MKTNINYECEICGRQYSEPEWALECESRKPPTTVPKYTMFGNHLPGMLYEGITFSAVEQVIEGHMLYVSMWATRGNGYSGDSLGEKLCGSSNSTNFTIFNGHLNPNHDTFKRMVEYLKANTPDPVRVWNGSEAVLLNQYIEEWNSKNGL